MSPRKAAALRDGDQTLREHLIAVAARLLADHGITGLTVRAIARQAQVADGVLYNHFTDKEELIAYAVHHHTAAAVKALGDLPLQAGTGTVQDNLETYVARGLGLLTSMLPTMAGLHTQPKLLARLHETQRDGIDSQPLRTALADYLRAEQRLGRLARHFNPEAATTILIGSCHDLVLPHLFQPGKAAKVEVPADFVQDLVTIVLHGIAADRPEE